MVRGVPFDPFEDGVYGCVQFSLACANVYPNVIYVLQLLNSQYNCKCWLSLAFGATLMPMFHMRCHSMIGMSSMLGASLLLHLESASSLLVLVSHFSPSMLPFKLLMLLQFSEL